MRIETALLGCKPETPNRPAWRLSPQLRRQQVEKTPLNQSVALYTQTQDLEPRHKLSLCLSLSLCLPLSLSLCLSLSHSLSLLHTLTLHLPQVLNPEPCKRKPLRAQELARRIAAGGFRFQRGLNT